MTPESATKIRADIEQLANELGALAGQCRSSLTMRQASRITLIGEPNVGKSSILNRLTGEQTAIVDAEAGTTRDLVRATIAINGLAVEIADTAGLRKPAGAIEQEGMRRAHEAARAADLTIEVRDCRQPDRAATAPDQLPAADLIVLNKIDAAGLKPGCDQGVIRLSAKTGAGIDLLAGEIARLLAAGSAETSILARQRHVDALDKALELLSEAAAANPDGDPEVAAELLRSADARLGEIVGVNVADDVLGEIFARFCIGK
ncbi:MAG: 50S ribosome-binding GTPase [Betaproteobacteria bacterium]|nr:50S ribosome-binding GTPase [Betaproteobacteria bacterium]